MTKNGFFKEYWPLIGSYGLTTIAGFTAILGLPSSLNSIASYIINPWTFIFIPAIISVIGTIYFIAEGKWRKLLWFVPLWLFYLATWLIIMSLSQIKSW